MGFLNIDGITKASFTISDMIGKTILQGSIDAKNNRINTSELATGGYIINITENGKTQKMKFIQQLRFKGLVISESVFRFFYFPLSNPHPRHIKSSPQGHNGTKFH